MLTTLEQKLDPRWTALLIVDMQNDYIDDHGVLGQKGRDLSACRAIVEPVTRLVNTARDANVSVVFIRNWHSADSDTDVWLEASNRRHPGGPRSAVAGTWGAEWYPPLVPEPADLQLNKTRYDAFINTDLEQQLRERGIRSVVVCGTTTNVCVESTARAAHMRDFYLVLPEDGCASPDPQLHKNTLVNIEKQFGVVVSIEDILPIWKS